MRASAPCESARGSYSIEGALSLTVFTACLMALLSILTIIKTEAEIGDALQETAMELSQYSYVWGRTEYLKDEAEDKIPALKKLLAGEDGLSDLALTGPAVAKLLTRENFARDNVDDWLKKQGIEKGYEGLDFMDTQVLMDGKTIVVAVRYDLKVQTFGFFDKVLHQRIAAVTYGLLPTDSALKEARKKPVESSIWQQSNFVRGKYFANEIRESKGYGAPVKPGQGIDLYDAASGTYVEVNSINLFLPTYSSQKTDDESDSADAASYAPRSEAVEKAMFGYAKGFRKDISGLGQEVVLADESTVKAVAAKRRILILIVPEEIQQNREMGKVLSDSAAAVQEKYGVSVEFRYEQKALIENKEGTTK